MNIKVAAAQYPLTSHKSIEAWRQHTAEWIQDAVKQRAQLLLFPEYGSMELVSLLSKEARESLTTQIKELQSLRDDFLQTYEELAQQQAVTVVAPSFPVVEGEHVYNRAYVFSASGLVGYQDKFFMTPFEEEDWGVESAPKVLTLFETSWGSFGIQICYDVEFVLGSQLLSSTAGNSLILAPSCTESKRGATRVHLSARARALEAQAYSVVSQTIGEAPCSPPVDQNYGYAAFYCPPDCYMPEEGIISTSTPQTAGWLVQELDFSRIDAVRNKGRVSNFKDQQRLHTSLQEEDIRVERKIVK